MIVHGEGVGGGLVKPATVLVRGRRWFSTSGLGEAQEAAETCDLPLAAGSGLGSSPMLSVSRLAKAAGSSWSPDASPAGSTASLMP